MNVTILLVCFEPSCNDSLLFTEKMYFQPQNIDDYRMGLDYRRWKKTRTSFHKCMQIKKTKAVGFGWFY